MASTICRLLPYAAAPGARNMAADEALLERAAAGIASVRFYGWSEATVSLGYFQLERLRYEDSKVAQLPYVRRPTGGATLVHHYEVTYALALPSGPPWQVGDPWLPRMHKLVAGALESLDVRTRIHVADGREANSGMLCFQHLTAGDLLIDAAKIVGSAQRRQRGALLQHGAILLARSPYAPDLSGIQELSQRVLSTEEVVKAVTRMFAQQTGWDLVAADWTVDEIERIAQLVAGKYSRDEWNCKR